MTEERRYRASLTLLWEEKQGGKSGAGSERQLNVNSCCRLCNQHLHPSFLTIPAAHHIALSTHRKAQVFGRHLSRVFLSHMLPHLHTSHLACIVLFFFLIEDPLMTGTSHPCTASHSCPGSFIFNLSALVWLNSFHHDVHRPEKPEKHLFLVACAPQKYACYAGSALIPRAWVRISLAALCMRGPACAALSGPTYKEQWDQLEDWIVPPWFRCITVHRGYIFTLFSPSNPQDQKASKVTCFCSSVACQSRRYCLITCSCCVPTVRWNCADPAAATPR